MKFGTIPSTFFGFYHVNGDRVYLILECTLHKEGNSCSGNT